MIKIRICFESKGTESSLKRLCDALNEWDSDFDFRYDETALFVETDGAEPHDAYLLSEFFFEHSRWTEEVSDALYNGRLYCDKIEILPSEEPDEQ